MAPPTVYPWILYPEPSGLPLDWAPAPALVQTQLARRTECHVLQKIHHPHAVQVCPGAAACTGRSWHAYLSRAQVITPSGDCMHGTSPAAVSHHLQAVGFLLDDYLPAAAELCAHMMAASQSQILWSSPMRATPPVSMLPLVLQFLGACTRELPYMIVTEFLPGGSLSDFFRVLDRDPQRAPSLRRSVTIALDCAKGLRYMHARRCDWFVQHLIGVPSRVVAWMPQCCPGHDNGLRCMHSCRWISATACLVCRGQRRV